MRFVPFFLLLISISSAGTHSYNGPSGPLSLSTQITIEPNVAANVSSARPGDSIRLDVSLQNYYYGSSFSATLTSPYSPGYTSGTTGTTLVNFASASEFSTDINYYNNCGYYDSVVGSGKIRCTNIGGANFCGSGCAADPTSGKTTGNKWVTYYEVVGSSYTSHSGGAYVAALCNGRWYVNGNDVGEITSGLIQYTITIPSGWSDANYPVTAEARYNCIFAAKETYSSHPTEAIFLYYDGTQIRDNRTINISTCFERANITIDSITNPITLNSTRQAQVSITIRNNGNVSMTVSSITPSIGTYTFSPSVPFTLSPGQTTTVTGTYTYPTTLLTPTTVTFTVTANGTQCGTPVTRTASATITVNPYACSENVGMTIDSINPITLNGTASGSTGTTTVRVRNTGTDAINLTSIGVTSGNGYFTIASPTLPVQIAGGGYIDVSGTYTYTGSALAFGQQISVTFLASGIGAKCGTPLSASRSTTATAPSCAETASISLAATNPITLNSTNQSQVTLTVTNTGNVAVTIAGAASITVNRGTFVPSASFPITINPGASANINGVYTYNGATPTTVTFTVTASATECGTPVTRSASYTSNVNKAACNETVAITAVATNPITLNFTNQSAAGVSVTNTGNMPVTISSVAVNRGAFAVSTPLPLTINPGATATINGVYSYNGATPTTVTFTVTGNGTECGVPVTRTASYTSNVSKAACNESASISLVATNPITLNSSNQSPVTLTVTNTGNVQITIPNAASITTSRGTFVPSGPFPITINPGLSANINGAYTYNGATPANVTFTVGGSATVCASPATISANYTSSINSCSYAGIEIVGVMPPTIVLDNKSADIEMMVRNNGSAALNVTSFSSLSSAFSFTIHDQLPASINPGEIITFTGTVKYTQSGTPPSTVTLRVSSVAIVPVCGANTANASITIPIPAKGDLEPEIFPAKTAMNQTEFSSANISVRNRGAGNITESTILMVKIMHCSAMFMSSCQIESEDNYTIGELDEGENETIVSADYQCEGYRYVGIRATANAEGLPVEDDFANNNDTVFIPCSRESCKVSGPGEMRLPGEYRFNVSCFDSDGNEQNCTDAFVVVPPGFRWDYSFPAGAITCSPASCIPVTEGDANENSSIYVSNILMNGTLSVTAKATTQLYHQEINCTQYVQIYPNPCILQI